MKPLFERQDFFDLLTGSYRRLLDRPLVPADIPAADGHRSSTEAPGRDERDGLFRKISHDGFAENDRSIRITKSGERFWTENVPVWQLIDEKGELHGQAARLPFG
jgi:hypothetical protein